MNNVEIQDLEEEINKRQKELENLKKLLKAKSVI
jgi:cell division protein FtsL